MQFTAKDIAALLGGQLEGNPDHPVNNIAKIEEANLTSLSPTNLFRTFTAWQKLNPL